MSAESPPCRPRFSLLTLLLLLTVAAMSVGTWQISKEVVSLRAEVLRLGEVKLQMQQTKRRRFQAIFDRWSRQLENSRLKLLAVAKIAGEFDLQSVAIAV